MERFLGKYAEYLYAILRIVAGLLFACHGAQKLLGVLGGIGDPPGTTAQFFSLIWWAGVIELLGGLSIALGFLASYVAFIASGEMAFAYFMVHFPQGFWPLQNRGELAIVYCFFFLYVAAKGAGKWSLAKSK